METQEMIELLEQYEMHKDYDIVLRHYNQEHTFTLEYFVKIIKILVNN